MWWWWAGAAYGACGPDPTTPAAWAQAAACLERKDLGAAAAIAWGRAGDGAAGTGPWADLGRGDRARARGHSAAVEAYDAVPSTSPAYQAPQYRRAVEAYRHGWQQTSVLAFREASRAEGTEVLAQASLVAIAAVYLHLERWENAETFARMVESGPLLPLALTVRAEALFRLGDRKGAIATLQAAGPQVPEALPLNVALARDPAYTFGEESARWRGVREALLRGEPVLDLPLVWGLEGPPPADKLAAQLLAEARERAIDQRVKRIDAALAAAHANAAGGQLTSFDVTLLDFGG